jgi:hypothetical protein
VTARPACVYRLLITYPEGSLESGWEPACWKNETRPDARDLLTSRRARKYRKWQRDRTFRWPRNHNFLSSSGAYDRAALLRSYGAVVEVQRSFPVEWPLFTEDTEEYGGSEYWPEFDASGIPRQRTTGEVIWIIDETKNLDFAALAAGIPGPGKEWSTSQPGTAGDESWTTGDNEFWELEDGKLTGPGCGSADGDLPALA